MRMSKLAAFGAAVVLMSGPAVASGQSIFDDTVSTCTGTNCSSLRIPATVFAFGPSAGTFAIDAFAAPGECVRFDLTSPSVPDMELVVVAPNGTVFRNDDRNGALDRRPVVKIGSAPNNGWYTVHVAQFAGAATEANVVLLYGRYPAGNPNCGAPTGPLVGNAVTLNGEELDDAAKTEPALAPAPKAGHPGSER